MSSLLPPPPPRSEAPSTRLTAVRRRRWRASRSQRSERARGLLLNILLHVRTHRVWIQNARLKKSYGIRIYHKRCFAREGFSCWHALKRKILLFKTSLEFTTNNHWKTLERMWTRRSHPGRFEIDRSRRIFM